MDNQGSKCCHRLNFHSLDTWDEGNLWPLPWGQLNTNIFQSPTPRGCDFCQIPFFSPLIPTLSRGRGVGVYIDSCIVLNLVSSKMFGLSVFFFSCITLTRDRSFLHANSNSLFVGVNKDKAHGGAQTLTRDCALFNSTTEYQASQYNENCFSS